MQVVDRATIRLRVWERGVGETPIIPPLAAVANAVCNAIGVRVRQLPMTPATILAALGRAPATGARA